LNAFTMANAKCFLLSHASPDLRIMQVSAQADEMRIKHGPPRPLEGPIW
jgi:hypothetical protein